MDMVERMSRAISPAWWMGYDETIRDGTPSRYLMDRREEQLEIARSVLAALREPTEAMIRAAHEHTQAGDYSKEERANMLWHWDSVWRAMIDAAEGR